MSASYLAATLPPVQRLALAYAPRARHEDWLAFLAFDARLAGIVRRAREPLPAQLRIAWWRDRLGEEPARWPAGEPLLALLAGRKALLLALPALVDAWEGLLAEPPLGLEPYVALAQARGGAIAALGDASDVARRAGCNWALVELAGQVPPGEDREVLCHHARVQDWQVHLPRSPLRVLHGLARRALARPNLSLLAGPADVLAALRFGLLGRCLPVDCDSTKGEPAAMKSTVFGAVAALLLVASGLFWWQGRAATEQGAPPPDIAAPADPEAEEEPLPDEDGAGLRGPALPEVDDETREERRFNRLDRDRDNLVTRNEMLGTRVAAFRKLDRDGNNLLSFEEWSVATSNRFKSADGNGDNRLTRQEFERTRPKEGAQPKCRC